MLRRRTRPTKNTDDTKSEAATATSLTINVVVDGGPAPPPPVRCTRSCATLFRALKSTSNVRIAGERVLDDPEDLKDATTAQIGLYANRGQDKSKAS